MTAPTITPIDTPAKLPSCPLRMTYTPPSEGRAYQYTPPTGLGGRQPRPVYFVVVETHDQV
jgi:hypothetical protein